MSDQTKGYTSPNDLLPGTKQPGRTASVSPYGNEKYRQWRLTLAVKVRMAKGCCG